MKKIALALIVGLLSGTTAFAQYHAGKGDFAVEVQFNPFGLVNQKFSESVSTQNFTMDGLRVRYFLSEKLALRANLIFDATNTSEEGWVCGTYGLNVGGEYHFNVAPRLSLYAGAETGFLFAPVSSVGIGSDGVPYEYMESRGVFSFRPLAGFDFYVYKGLFVGTEFGFHLKAGLNSRDIGYCDLAFETVPGIRLGCKF